MVVQAEVGGARRSSSAQRKRRRSGEVSMMRYMNLNTHARARRIDVPARSPVIHGVLGIIFIVRTRVILRSRIRTAHGHASPHRIEQNTNARARARIR